MEFPEDFVYLFDIGRELIVAVAGGGGVFWVVVFEADEAEPTTSVTRLTRNFVVGWVEF